VNRESLLVKKSKKIRKRVAIRKRGLLLKSRCFLISRVDFNSNQLLLHYEWAYIYRIENKLKMSTGLFGTCV